MSDPTVPEAPGASAPADATGADRRRQRWLTRAGVVLLVAGIAVCVVGRLDASSASDDLATANARLHTQQRATAKARQCEDRVRTALAPAVSTARAVVATAGTIADQDAQIASALRDGQAAGAQARIDDFNRARDRGNAAVNAANAAVDTSKSQRTTLQQQANALPTDCPAAPSGQPA